MPIETGVQGPATISGFHNLASCEAAKPIVVEFFKKSAKAYGTVAECIEFSAKPLTNKLA